MSPRRRSLAGSRAQGSMFTSKPTTSTVEVMAAVIAVSYFALLVAVAASRWDSHHHIGTQLRHPLLFLPPAALPAGGHKARPWSAHTTSEFRSAKTELEFSSSTRPGWVGRRGEDRASLPPCTTGGYRVGAGRSVIMMAASGGGQSEASGANAGNGDDDDIDWGKVNPKEGQKPDWDKILPKSRLEDNAVEMPPQPEAFSKMDPKERLRAYAGMLEWNPVDPNEEEPKEKTYETLSEEMQDEWLANKLQSALRKNRNVEKNVNKWYIEDRFEEGKEDLEKTAQALKEQYAEDAERIQKELLEEFDKGARAMDIKIANIIARGRGNFTQSTGPLTETTPFPSNIAAGFAGLAEDEAAFYEELGVAPPSEGTPRADDIMTAEERNQIEAELRALPPSDVVKAASAQAANLERRNASSARRAAEAAGNVVVVGASDGDLGARVMALFEAEAGMSEEGGSKGPAGVAAVVGVSLNQARALDNHDEVKTSLRGAKTLVIVPADHSRRSGAKPRGGEGLGSGLGGFFGGGGDAAGEEKRTAELTDEEATRVLRACGEGLKHVVCLSVGSARGGGGVGGGLFGRGGQDDKNFPPESATEQAVVRVSKAKGFSYTTIRVTKLAGDRNAADSAPPAPLIIPKNAPRPTGGKLPDASRSVAADALLRASYQPETRRNSTFVVSDFPENQASWPVPAGDWADEFLKLTGPEMLRVAIPAEFQGGSGTFKAWSFLREWAQLWTEEGTGLTTRVKIFTDDEKRRTGLYFDPSQRPYKSAKEEREAEAQREEARKGKGKVAGAPSSKAGKNSLAQEGGIDIVVEEKPYPRVRAMRANMGPKTVVKEMSERLILDGLKKDIKAFITDRKSA